MTFYVTFLQDASNTINVEDILTSWDVINGKCYTLSTKRTIGELEALYGSHEIYIKWIDGRTNDWGQDRLVFQKFQFDIDGLYPTQLFIDEKSKQFNTSNIIKTTNGDRIIVTNFNVTVNYVKVKSDGNDVIEVSPEGIIRVKSPNHLDAEKVDSIGIDLRYTVPLDPTGQTLSDSVVIEIIDANDMRPSIVLDYTSTTTSTCRPENFESATDYEQCLFDELNNNGVTYATLLPPYDLDKTSPNNNVTTDIFTNPMINDEPVFYIELIDNIFHLRYNYKFDFCLLDTHKLKLKMCDKGFNQNCVFHTVTLHPPPHSPNCVCVDFDIAVTSDNPFHSNDCISVAMVDVYTREKTLFLSNALTVTDGYHQFEVEHLDLKTVAKFYDKYLVCVDKCGTKELYFTFTHDQQATIKIYKDTLQDCLLCPVWVIVIASILLAILILCWIGFIAYGLYKRFGPVKHRALEETYTKSFKQGFYLCCLIEIPMPCSLYTVIKIVILYNFIILLFIIIVSCTVGWTICLALAMLLWFLIGLSLASLAVFVLQYGIWKLLDKYFNKGQFNQTIHNHTHCSGHSGSALLIREKRTRPDQDLGTILKAYKAEADREEYKFRMVLDNDDFDCSISPPEPEIRQFNRDCDLVFLIEGSDSFDENPVEFAFQHSIKWAIDLVEKLYHSVDFDSFYVSMVQFSGLKQCVGCYIPGSGGIDHDSKMFHYKTIYARSEVTDDRLQKVIK